MPDPNTVINEDAHWSESLVGDNAERAEALKAFGTADEFFASHDALAAKDWRKEIAGDDDKFLSTIQRYGAPVDLGNAFREQKQMISANQIQKPLGPEATEDDIKVYREQNGIPLEAAGYLENLPEGVVLGDDDKVVFEDFAGAMHKDNVDPKIMHSVINWYNGFAEQEQDAQAELDNQQSTEANDQLRSDWGNDYRVNINLAEGMIAKMFGVKAAEQMLSGRYPDGRAFLNDPDVLKGFADHARKTEPLMEMGGGDHHTLQQSLNDEIATLEKFMRDDRPAYNRDEGGKATRLGKLYQIRINQAAA